MIKTCPVLILHAVVFATVLADEPVIHLEDQYGRETRVVPADSGQRVLLYSDRDGSRDSRAWIKIISEGGWERLDAANLEAVPAIARPFVRRGFRDGSPVLLDWHGEIARGLGFEAAVPNLYLFDAAGRQCGYLAGRADEERRQQLRRLMNLCARSPPI